MTVIDTAAPVRPGEEIDPRRIKPFLSDHIPGVNGDIRIRQYPGGYSNLTYLIELGARRMVLRRPPVGANVAAGHDMAREFNVLSAIYPVFPFCPRPLAFSGDESIIGAPFFVMEQMSGIILRRDLPEGLTFSPDRAHALCGNLIDLLARIHAIDVETAGLDFIGKPAGYVQRQMTGWAARYQKARTPDAPDFQPVIAWLSERMPPDTARPAIVHNDYKLDNVVLDAACPESIIGVLDWEMATCGDPLMDLGNSLAYWVQDDDPDELQMIRTMPTHIDGAMTRRQIIDRYKKQTGRDIPAFEFYYCFGLFRLAVIAQQIYSRYFHKKTRNPRFASLIHAVQCLEKAAVKVTEGQPFI